MRTLQFTIPAGGPTPDVVQLTFPGDTNKANNYYQQITIQNNNASGNLRIGDSSVSASQGISIYPGGSSITITASLSLRAIQEIWVYGTPGALVDVLLLE